MAKKATVTTEMTRVFDLNPGDIFLNRGIEYTFIRFMKGRRKFIAQNGQDGYRYKLGSFDFPDGVMVVRKDEKMDVNDKADLKEGDLFLLCDGGRRKNELFRFVCFEGKKVKALNPMTNERYSIDLSFRFVKLENLPF